MSNLYGSPFDEFSFNSQGELKTDIPRSAFGEVLTTGINPVVQLQFPYNINTRLVATTVANTGTVTQTNSMAVVGTGTTTASTAKMESLKVVKYNPGQGAVFKGTALFTTTAELNPVQEVGLGDDDDGFFVGIYNGGFAINRRSGGVDNIIPQTNFNMDNLTGFSSSRFNIDPTKGNVFAIAIQYLGFGNVFFQIEDPATGEFFPFHIIKYANTAIVPIISNPTLPVRVFVDNADTTENLIVSCGSLAGFTEGVRADDGPLNFAADLGTTVSTSLIPILSIRNKSTYQGVTNKVLARILDAAIINTGNTALLAKFILNGTLGGGTSFVDIDTNTSIMEKDIASTTITSGVEFLPFLVNKDESKDFDLTDEEVDLKPGDTLTLAAISSGSGTTADDSISWKELF